jgi:predicted nucleic acid-binding Zn ribbon protein
VSEYVYVRVSEHVRAIMDQDKGRIRLKTIYIYGVEFLRDLRLQIVLKLFGLHKVASVRQITQLH